MEMPDWRSILYEVSRHFPPSGQLLRLADASLMPGPTPELWRDLRPDVVVTQVDPKNLPLDASTYDAIAAYGALSMLWLAPEGRDAFLRAALRLLRPGGRLVLFDPPEGLPWPDAYASLMAMFERADYRRILLEHLPFGFVCRGEKHLPAIGAEDATYAPQKTPVNLIEAGKLHQTLRGSFVFLLCQKNTTKAPWTVQPGESETWEAALAHASQREHPALIAFSTLPKAVQFMQHAVKQGTLTKVNKIAKFEKAVVDGWMLNILLDPAFDRLSMDYELAAETRAIDSSLAVVGDE